MVKLGNFHVETLAFLQHTNRNFTKTKKGLINRQGMDTVNYLLMFTMCCLAGDHCRTRNFYLKIDMKPHVR
jgi:hypothetical protein